MSASPAPKPQPPTVPQLAREVMRAHDGNVRAAAGALTDMLLADRKLLLLLSEQIVREAALSSVEAAHRHRRQAIMQAVASSSGRSSVIALANGITLALLDMPLAGGLRLREAGPEEVADQARRYRAQADDMSHKSRWLYAIVKLMKPGQTVGEVITEERARKLLQEASR